MVTLVILDGFGLRRERNGNAIKASEIPFITKLIKKYPNTTLEASGEEVGLPKGQMGNSEVGHLTLGAGRVIYQDLLRINKDIENGKFGENKNLIKAYEHASKTGRLHLMGLLSDGGVHSHISHLFALIEEAEKYNIKEIYIHAFLDGRDTPFNSALTYLDALHNKFGDEVKLASLSGRVYAMDREKKYERIQKVYSLLTDGRATDKSYREVVEESYQNGVYDEFLEPVLLDSNGKIKDGDSVIFFNFRSDRAREVTSAFTEPDFDSFKVKKFSNLLFSTMQEYSQDFKNVNIIYPANIVENNLSKIISDKGLKQFHIAETTKYAHVTFFFNGGREKEYESEDRKLIESENTTNFEYYPNMKAGEITQEVLDQIASEKYDFILVNLSNLDMIGHTGNFQATVDASKFVDKCAYAIALASLMAGGECIITADHGNAEYMIDENGNKVTSHTTNKVPFILVTKRKVRLRKGGLKNVAPTVLKLMNIDIPDEMERPLF